MNRLARLRRSGVLIGEEDGSPAAMTSSGVRRQTLERAARPEDVAGTVTYLAPPRIAHDRTESTAGYSWDGEESG